MRAASSPAPIDAGVPESTTAVAIASANRAARVLGALFGSGWQVTVDPAVVAAHVLLPAILAARDGTMWPRPRPPRPVAGGGFVAADLGAPGDEEAFERLVSTLPATTTAADVERAAQEWRLPVVAYRTRRPVQPSPPPAPPHRVPDGAALPVSDPAAPLRGLTVVDLTAMWAGPLASRLLAGLGATVTKIESAVRPDGMRAQAALFAALDAGKGHLELDLRTAQGLDALRRLLGWADVVLDSFSPRVMPNFGLDAPSLLEINPRLVAVSLPAFPPGSAEGSWVSYGTGVHAFLGLGDLGDGRFAAPAVTYPDPLGGFAALEAVLGGLAAGGGSVVAASLVDAVAPVAAAAPCEAAAALARPVEPVAASLASGLGRRGLLGPVTLASPFTVERR